MLTNRDSLRSTLRISSIAASLCLGLSGLAMAQTAPIAAQDSPRAERMQKKHAKMAGRQAQSLDALKAKLKLDTSQEAAWTAFAQSMQSAAGKMAYPDRAALSAMTTPERIDQMQARQAAQHSEMQKRADATRIFYAVLQNQQKQVFDSETASALRGMAYKMHSKTGHQDGHHSRH